MALATWWSADPLPDLRPLPGLHTTTSTDDAELAQLNRISPKEVRTRRQAGHHPYIASIFGKPAAYGWVATREASIGELGLAFALPPGHRYLWDFATLPAWQGRGLYPRLLRAILTREAPVAERFWIIHAPENLPSGAGMGKAGLLPVGQLSFALDGSVGLAPLGPIERAQAGAELLGVPLIETVLAPCWCCGSTVEQRAGGAASCWPPIAPSATRCTCAIPVKPSAAPAA